MAKHDLNVDTLDSGLSTLDSFGVPHLDEYFGLWSILEEPFRAAVARVRGIDLRVHVAERQRSTKEEDLSPAYEDAQDYIPMEDGNGIAVINLVGPLMKYDSSVSGGSSTIRARRRLRNDVANQAVSAILLRIDSPGGTVAGTRDLAMDVAAAAKKKPVWTYMEDMAASAAYYVGSQATRVYANATAMLGGIGTFTVIEDSSEMAENLGIKVHVIRSGEFKGGETPGAEVTEAYLADVQQIVNDVNALFVKDVAAGRKLALATVEDLADGRVHVGASAKKLKLIDGVQSLDETLSQLARSSTPRSRSNTMADASQPIGTFETSTPFVELKTAARPASFEDLKILCPGADNDFLCEQLGRKVTEDQARTAWAEEQNRRLAAKEEELAETKAQAAAAKDAGGLEPVETGSGKSGAGAGDAVAEFGQRVAEEMKTGLSKADATKAVVKADPELQAAYVETHNAEVGPSSYRG